MRTPVTMGAALAVPALAALALAACAPPASTAAAPAPWPAGRAAPRADSNSMRAHRELLDKRTRGRIDVYFVGNSIVRRWGATDYPDLLAHWRASFHGWNAANFGWGGDRVEHVLWRLEQGELDGVHPKVIVLLAGTNDVGRVPGGAAKVDDVAGGVAALVALCRRKAPGATIVLTSILPRDDSLATAPAIAAEIAAVNARIARLADGTRVRWLDVHARLADARGRPRPGVVHDGLHPTVAGYQAWADLLRPVLAELLGPPVATDLAPPPTGDPSARSP